MQDLHRQDAEGLAPRELMQAEDVEVPAIDVLEQLGALVGGDLLEQRGEVGILG